LKYNYLRFWHHYGSFEGARAVVGSLSAIHAMNGSSVCLILVKKQRGKCLLSPLLFPKKDQRHILQCDRQNVNKSTISGIEVV
jgi:hypothetical protein